MLATWAADVPWCDRLARAMGDSLEPGLEWLVGTLAAAQSRQEAEHAARRIADLGAAVKPYSQLDVDRG